MAETIYVRGEGGGIHAMDLPLHESIEQRLAKGQLVRVNQDGSRYTGLDPEAAPAPPAARPGKTAVKAEWAGWAVAVHGLDPERAEAMTKGDLMALPEQPGGPLADTPVGGDGRPGDQAPKAEWIDYVARKGLLSREDAANYTRDDLVELSR